MRSRGTIRMPVAHGQARGDTRYAELRKTGAPWGSPYAADQACLIAGNPPRSAAARACMRSSPAGRRHRHVRVFGNHRPGNVRAGLCQRQATLPMPTLTRLQHNLHAEVLVSARHGRWEAVNCCACRAHAASRTHQLLLPSTLLAAGLPAGLLLEAAVPDVAGGRPCAALLAASLGGCNAIKHCHNFAIHDGGHCGQDAAIPGGIRAAV